jgi:hypothetical protein
VRGGENILTSSTKEPVMYFLPRTSMCAGRDPPVVQLPGVAAQAH